MVSGLAETDDRKRTIAGQDHRRASRLIRLGRGRDRVRPDLAGRHTGLIFHGRTLQTLQAVNAGRYS